VITKSPLDEPIPVGIITDRDIVFAQLDRKAELNRTRAEDVMTRDPLVLSEGDSVEDAILRLRARGVRRAPVVTAHGKLAGFISSDDLIAHVARELTTLAHAIEQQPRHEAR
jgi:CBS domain-containing protein